jgi:hypothetical protein
LIVSEFVTLDGVMEAPGGEPTHPHTRWVFDFISDGQQQFKLREVLEADAHLIGRVTYRELPRRLPQRKGEFADKVNSMPKYVATTALDELESHNSIPIKGRGRRGGDEAQAARRLGRSSSRAVAHSCTP